MVCIGVTVVWFIWFRYYHSRCLLLATGVITGAAQCCIKWLKWRGITGYASWRYAKVMPSGPGAFEGEDMNMACWVSAVENVCQRSSGLHRVVDAGVGEVGGGWANNT
jgi:hypothetical protein